MTDIVQCEQSGLTLVFGLSWEPVIGSHGRAQALRLSRKAGSTHMVFSGGVMAAVGHGTFAAGKRRRPAREWQTSY